MSYQYRDTMPDTWVAIDRQGRPVSVQGDSGVPEPRPEKILAMFYFIWHGSPDGSKEGGPFDVTKILEEHPDALDNPDSPPWGPLFTNNDYTDFYHWGESLFGYYQGADEYVLRKHAQMLSDAGVDLVIFDHSNVFDTEPPKNYYMDNFLTLFKVFAEVRAEGKKAPCFAFLGPFWAGSHSVERLYRDIYSKGLYRDLWFMWKGKPLILFDPEKVSDPVVREFFTFRRNQPSYFEGMTRNDEWSWNEKYPQHAFYSSDNPDKPEQCCVGMAQNAVCVPDGVRDAMGAEGWRAVSVGGEHDAMSDEQRHSWAFSADDTYRVGVMSERDEQGRYIACGRSYHDGRQPQPGEADWKSEYGYNFLEQWSRAFEIDPEVVFVTGWNEWLTGRFHEFLHYKAPSVFVDNYCQEFSRDIEPMKGGHWDDYYYQLIDNVRKYKGARPLPVSTGSKTIDIDGCFTQWRDVGPEYLDDIWDCPERNHRGWGEAGPYLTPAGRNDFEQMKVAYDDRNVYFYVRTVGAISPATGENWMHLFIRTADEGAPNWETFQYVVNRKLVGKNLSTLERSRGGFDWEQVCEVKLRIEHHQMMFAVPRSALGLGKAPPCFDFKWTDHTAPWEDMMQLYTHGDTAPNGRFCYRFTGK